MFNQGKIGLISVKRGQPGLVRVNKPQTWSNVGIKVKKRSIRVNHVLQGQSMSNEVKLGTGQSESISIQK